MGQVILKDMKLVFTIYENEEKWIRTIEDMNGNPIWTNGEEPLLYDQRSEDMLDAWEEQMKQLPVWNIVSHERIYV